jgi:hypothetical protein
MGSTLGPNSGSRAGVILTHPNSFPFPRLSDGDIIVVYVIGPRKCSILQVFSLKNLMR